MRLVYLTITKSYQLFRNQVASKEHPKQKYIDYDIDNFKSNLNKKLLNLSSIKYDDFEKTFLYLLKKILRHNNGYFKTKKLLKQFMKRSKLKNKYNNKRNYENWFRYKKYFLTLLKKTIKAYFEKLSIKEIGDSKTFLKTAIYQ